MGHRSHARAAWHCWLIAMLAVLLFVCAMVRGAEATPQQDPPEAALRYRKIWKREFRRGGLHPDYETLMLGQLTQESRWDPNAVSPAGAEGLAQFMGGTVRLMERAYGEDLRGLGGPRAPQWALRAFNLLMREDLLLFRAAPDRITRFRWGSAAYNGGPSLLRRERAIRDSWMRDLPTCREAGRSLPACHENLDYAGHAIRFAPRFRGY